MSKKTLKKSAITKKRVFSGSRATGRLHLGNYLGAIKGYLELTAHPDYECIFMVMDLHSVTTPYDPATLSQSTREIILDYLAAGLDPEKAVITAQSLVPEHTYLAFLLSSIMTVARLRHLPTYKEKVAQHPDNNTLALLSYPVLMAADILLYKAQLVPVGIDQEPHLEIARELARKMNERFGTDFPECQRFAMPGEYVPSLKGEGKMSKSVEGSYIGLTDDLAMILRKLKTAPTDSGQGKVREKKKPSKQSTTSVSSKFEFVDQATGQASPGVENLMTFVELIESKEKREFYQEQYEGKGIRYGELKQELAEAIYQMLLPIQAKRAELETKTDYINQVILDGAKKAAAIAGPNLEEIKQAIGIKPVF